MNTELKNNILAVLARLLAENKQSIIEDNELDVAACDNKDAVILDRLIS
jgi:gamma-glutamyl phosphate reductase